jgi:shikimate dehydrogenase
MPIQFGLIGKSLKHSFSKDYFSKKFIKSELDFKYENLEFDSIEDLNSSFSSLMEDFNGFNVTIPYKSVIIPLLDRIDPIAQKIGSVNCVTISNGLSKGYNTDYLGFIESIKDLNCEHYESAYVLGSGGASNAVFFALTEYFHIPTTIVSRGDVGLNYKDFKSGSIPKKSIIVNTTPLGMFPSCELFPDINYDHLDQSHLCIDLIYNPNKTIFLEKSENQGAKIINGEKMLISQAELGWDLWKKTI